ncbi:MAG: DUF1772 domain-containing protein [Acetobacteraceae bacterium]|nr:DUF1772 domain-containing protein [Acetobacteraceae bacterium]
MALMLAVALTLGLLAAGWSAGFFWAWSFTVMPGFAAAAPEAAVSAMRAVNANIVGPGFAFVFFGPAVLAALSAALAFAAGARAAGWVALAAATIYAAGVIGVTFAANIPLNNALAAASSAPEAAAEVWRGFAGPWTAWNHLRTAAATLAFLVVALSAVLWVRA